MTINYHPDNVEQTALWRGTMQLTLQDPVGHIFLVHIPIVDLPQSMIDEVPPEERYRGLNARLPQRMVILCLN